MKTITKKQLAEELSAMNGNSPVVNEQFINDLKVLIKSHLRSGNEIALRKFGSFRIVETKPKKGQDMNKGITINIPSRKRVKFVPAPCIKFV